jgi:hypothetical protein
VPLNMVQNQAPPAEFMRAPAPGTPPTFAVDTSTAGPPMEGGGRRTPRSRSQSPGTNRVSVKKMGGESEGPVPASTRVTVVKSG